MSIEVPDQNQWFRQTLLGETSTPTDPSLTTSTCFPEAAYNSIDMADLKLASMLKATSPVRGGGRDELEVISGICQPPFKSSSIELWLTRPSPRLNNYRNDYEGGELKANDTQPR